MHHIFSNQCTKMFSMCHCLSLGKWQMSPLQSIGRDILSPVGEFGILQKLEEVDNSLKVNSVQ